MRTRIITFMQVGIGLTGIHCILIKHMEKQLGTYEVLAEGGGWDAYVKLELKGDSLKVQYPERIKDGNLYYLEVFGKSTN